MENIGLTNMHDKFSGDYKDFKSYRNTDNTFVYVADFVEEILCMYNELDKESDRIDVHFDPGTLARWNVAFDSLTISLYREGRELEKGFDSNYMYTEFDGERNFWIDLYFSPEDYDPDEVFMAILTEFNNFFNRDFKEYLENEHDKD